MSTWELRQEYDALQARSERELLNFHERVYLARLRRKVQRAERAERLRAREQRRVRR